MKKLCILFTAVIAAAVLSVGWTSAAKTAANDGASSASVPFNMNVFIPCAGEWVALSGDLHLLSNVTINDNNAVVKVHAQPQGVTGEGLVTGDKYNATGVTQSTTKTSFVNGSSNFTFVNNFRIIGQGADNNYLVHMLVHVTVNANGDVTATVGETTSDCK